MQAAGRRLILGLLASGLLGLLAAPAPAAFISSTELGDLPWLHGVVVTPQAGTCETSAISSFAGKPLWWPEDDENGVPRLVLGKAPALPSGQCGSPSQLIGSQAGCGQVAIAAETLEKDPVLVSRLAIAERKLSRLPPVLLELLRPA